MVTYIYPDCLIWYIDGSKSKGGTGSGIHARTSRSKVCISLDTMATAYQAEL